MNYRVGKVTAGVLSAALMAGALPPSTVYAADGWQQGTDGGWYWYEGGVRQGTEGRGKEIYDPGTDAWYWLDAIDGGRKAVSKDVYQDTGDAGEWAEKEDGTGKWVRYDSSGRMVKGWCTDERGKYYFDLVYGTMAKGDVIIEGKSYRFDTVTGCFESELEEQEPDLEPKLQRETEHFLLYCTDQDVKALDDLVNSLEGCYERTTSDLGKAPSDKTRVDIYPDLQAYHNAIGRPDAPDWSVGQSGNGRVYMVSPLNPGPSHNYNSIITVAVHEYVHVLVRLFNRRQPTYLNEGIACYEAGQNANYKSSIQKDIEKNALPSMDDMDMLFAGDSGRAYNYSRAYVDFVVETFGFDKIISQLEGKSQMETYGISREQLNEQWIAFLKKAAGLDLELKLQRETEHFLLYCTDQDVKALDDLVNSLEGCYERTTSDLGKAPSNKTRVDIYPDLQAYHNAIGRPDDPDWSVGQAGNGRVYMVSPLNPGPSHNYNSIITVAVHEYVHVLVRLFNRRQPTYLNEGIACYEAGQSANYKSSIRKDIEKSTLPSMDDMESIFSGDAGRAYNYSRAYIDFVVETFGFDKIISQLEGKSQMENYGISREQLNEQWTAFLKKAAY